MAAAKRTRTDQQDLYSLGQVRDGFLVVDEFGQPLRPEPYSDLWRDLLHDRHLQYLDLRAALGDLDAGQGSP